MENRVRELRENAGYSQARLAQILGVHFNTIGNWESGECDVKSASLVQLAALFGVSVEHVMGLPEAN